MKNKVIIFGSEKDKIFELVQRYGFEVVENNPDFVVSYGGDGTVVLSEEKYPGIPKIILRNSRICKLCSHLGNDEILEKVADEKYVINEYWKLAVQANDQTLFALNEIIVHNHDPRHAIRYRLMVNDKQIGHEIIGDGVVVATPFGSTGYYRSITDSFFEVGIGLAFNNSIERSDHMILKEDSRIELEVTRGPAVVFADNQNDKIELKLGDKVLIIKSQNTARIVKV